MLAALAPLLEENARLREGNASCGEITQMLSDILRSHIVETLEARAKELEALLKKIEAEQCGACRASGGHDLA